MKVVYVDKARDLGGYEVQPVQIIIERHIPRPASIAEGEAHYQKQAESLADALLGSLPQGISDRLLAELLKRKASNLAYIDTARWR